jgi:phosphopantetheinyl transferase (holo-ACP synthase)
MRIIGVGTDLAKLSRFVRHATLPTTSLLAIKSTYALNTISQTFTLARRILKPGREMEEYERLMDEDARKRYLAARWCAKEAVYKALYPCNKLTWKRIYIDSWSG